MEVNRITHDPRCNAFTKNESGADITLIIGSGGRLDEAVKNNEMRKLHHD